MNVTESGLGRFFGREPQPKQLYPPQTDRSLDSYLKIAYKDLYPKIEAYNIGQRAAYFNESQWRQALETFDIHGEELEQATQLALLFTSGMRMAYAYHRDEKHTRFKMPEIILTKNGHAAVYDPVKRIVLLDVDRMREHMEEHSRNRKLRIEDYYLFGGAEEVDHAAWFKKYKPEPGSYVGRYVDDLHDVDSAEIRALETNIILATRLGRTRAVEDFTQRLAKAREMYQRSQDLLMTIPA